MIVAPPSSAASPTPSPLPGSAADDLPHVPGLPGLAAQLDRLVELGVHEKVGLTETGLRAAAAGLAGERTGTSTTPLLVLHPSLVSARELVPLLRREGRPGFVVVDMVDLDEFTPTVLLPEAPLYLVHGVERGDELRGASPEEALPLLQARGRSPLTIHEGIGWLLQQPEALEPNHCFMCLGSRRAKPRGGFDSRTPALWISGGTGRDGRENRGAPKLGWCWWRNRHDWLGFASVAGRTGVTGPVTR